MKLSVVIVNYNVKFFLEQCLTSVIEATRYCEAEIFVVDNNSVDGSVALVKSMFPQVKLIENKINYGFSYANNQAIKQAQGEYILLLNPDTIIESKTFEVICSFMDSHPDAGGLGVKMIDGKGRFLPESKRGLPNPSVAFYKIFGFSKFFPKSKRFGKYHLSYLDKDKEHKVEVLSGAFMLLRKTVLDKIGLLDEAFFMYGEDIDLSYRITQAGYNNYYIPYTTIVHYKGESTKKASLNYVIIFYNAMIIFAKKHFSSSGLSAKIMIFLIKMAIFLRASLSIASRVFKFIITPVLDALVIVAGFLIIAPLWLSFKSETLDNYPHDIFVFALVAYVLIWIISLFFCGGYDKQVKLKNIYKGIFVGALIILIFYSLMPETRRFSRAVIILGSVWTILVLPLFRFCLFLTGIKIFSLYFPRKNRILIIGSKNESSEIAKVLENNINVHAMFFANPLMGFNDDYFAGDLSQLNDIVQINKIDEIIFCAKDLKSEQIIETMLSMKNQSLNYKIARPEGISIIGSSSINTINDLYNVEINTVLLPKNKRNKRFVDLLISFLMLVFYPILFIFFKKPFRALKHLFSILIGKRTFVSYCCTEKMDVSGLPKLRKGYFSLADNIKRQEASLELCNRLNVLYAKDYNIFTDVIIIFKSWRKIGLY